jgi:hypothetical protein
MLLRRKTDVHGADGREEEVTPFPLDLEVFEEHAAIPQSFSYLFASVHRHDDAPGSHGGAMGRSHEELSNTL